MSFLICLISGVAAALPLIFPALASRAPPVPIFMCIILGFVGLMLGVRRMSDGGQKGDGKAAQPQGGIPKILDSSVLIDGRILDVARTGFIDGPFIVPAFIIDELRRITDNADALKRNRGKRGVDIVGAMQQEKNVEVIMSAQDYDEGDTDFKLLKLAEDLGAKIITNDYNLNIPRYVDTLEQEEEFDLAEIKGFIEQDKKEIAELEAIIAEQLKILGV